MNHKAIAEKLIELAESLLTEGTYGAKKTKRQRWMTEYEKLMLAMGKAQPGKMDWDTASYFYLSGLSPSDAANKYKGGG